MRAQKRKSWLDVNTQFSDTRNESRVRLPGAIIISLSLVRIRMNVKSLLWSSSRIAIRTFLMSCCKCAQYCVTTLGAIFVDALIEIPEIERRRYLVCPEKKGLCGLLYRPLTLLIHNKNSCDTFHSLKPFHCIFYFSLKIVVRLDL